MHVDQTKAALHGIAVAQVAQTIQLAASGMQGGALALSQDAHEAVPDHSGELDRARPLITGESSGEHQKLRSTDGSMVSLRELVDCGSLHLEADYLSQESEVVWCM